jgi:hypothetical protein
MKRRWTRFSVRSLLALVTICCLALSAFTILVHSDPQAYHREQRALAELRRLDGGVSFVRRPRAPVWLQEWRDPIYLGRVVHLKTRSRVLSEKYFAELSVFEHLESLAIVDGNAVTDDALARLAGISTLRSLSFQNTRVHASGKHMLQHLRLDKLTLSTGDLGAIETDWIADLDELKQLALHGPLTDSDLESLAELANLEVLTIRSDGITDAGLVHLAGLSNVRVIELYCPVTDAGMVHLVPLKRLEHLVCRPDSRVKRFVDSQFMPIGAKFIEIPLVDAVNVIQKLTHLPIRIADAELLAAGIAVGDVKLTVDGSSSLARALDAMLQPHGLAYYVKPDGLVLTTKNAAEKRRPGTTRLLQGLPNLDVYVPW